MGSRLSGTMKNVAKPLIIELGNVQDMNFEVYLYFFYRIQIKSLIPFDSVYVHYSIRLLSLSVPSTLKVNLLSFHKDIHSQLE